METFKKDFLNISTKNGPVKKRRHITDLSNFTPLRTYVAYDIDPTTSMEIVDMLIQEAKQTTKFSFTTYYREESDKTYFVIDFIQPTSSILINVEIFKDPPTLNTKIQELLFIIFYSSNTIYTWNYLSFPPVEFLIYDMIYCPNSEKINANNFISIQHLFKYWYNRTFKHDENCREIIDFTDSDGPLCSCSYRPYKFPTDNWSLSMAIMFTFNESFHFNDNPLNQCLAITKLAIVIEEQRNRQQIEALRKD